MKTNLNSLARRTAAFALAVLLAVPPVFASAGEKKLQTSIDILDGLTYRNTITENNGSRVESFSLELDEDSDISPILLQGSGSIYGTASIPKAVASAQSQGYHVVGALNTDFFSMTTGVPMGIVVEDGTYKSSGADENALLIIDGEVSIMERPVVSLTLTREEDGQTVTPNYFNKLRNDSGGIYLLNYDFDQGGTHISSPGLSIRMELARRSEPLSVNSTLELEVTEVITGSEEITLEEDEYLLTTADASGYNFVLSSFHEGDTLTLETMCNQESLSRAQWACGVGDILIRDGQVTDSSSWTYKNDGRQPRSAIGMRKDGTLLLYAADGRQSNYSIGLSEKDLADELLRQDCLWAVNVDGGGSTAMSVWVPGQRDVSLQSQPSGGKPRGCATYLLLVSEEEGNGRAHRLAMAEQGLVLLTGTSVSLPDVQVLDEGLNLLEDDPGELRFTSREDLGEISGGIYTAGSQAGTDTVRFRSEDDLEGSVQLHIVDQLTSLTVSRSGESQALTSLSPKPGEQIQLQASGSYWGRTALRDWSALTCTVQGDVGSVDQNGLFTASDIPTAGSITFSAGGMSQTIEIVPARVHNDVGPDHWAYTAVEYCYAHDIVSGISSTEFGRDHHIRRGDFMLMLHNALGKPSPSGQADFTDVQPTDYYYTALSWGQEVGLASGTGDGAYSPNAPVTREQAFTILRQALPLIGKDCPDGDPALLAQFSDCGQIAAYALPHTATLVSQGLVSGKGDGIDPQGSLTRAEMAAILYKAITFTPSSNTGVPVVPPIDPSGFTLTLDTTEMLLAPGDITALNATVSPSLEGASITWKSSNSASATVSSTGVVTNLHPGPDNAVVTITAAWNGLTASCTVTCAPAQQAGVVTDAEDGLRVRSGPDTSYNVIGSLSNGQRVAVLGEENGWYQVLFADKTGQPAIGYVSGSYFTPVL